MWPLECILGHEQLFVAHTWPIGCARAAWRLAAWRQQRKNAHLAAPRLVFSCCGAVCLLAAAVSLLVQLLSAVSPLFFGGVSVARLVIDGIARAQCVIPKENLLSFNQ